MSRDTSLCCDGNGKQIAGREFMSSMQSKLRLDMTKRMAAKAKEGESKRRLSGTRKNVKSEQKVFFYLQKIVR